MDNLRADEERYWHWLCSQWDLKDHCEWCCKNDAVLLSIHYAPPQAMFLNERGISLRLL